MKNSKKAFSLVEIIFVIVIISIIAAVAVPKLMGTKASASAATMKQDITTISASIQSYYMLNGKIEKISDAVNINQSRWNVSDKQLEYKIDELTCITIDIKNNKLNITIDKSAGEVCQKLYDDGIRNDTIDLF